MDNTIDATMNQMDRELTFLQTQMESLSQQFIQETATFASEWYQKTIVAYLVKNSKTAPPLNKQSLILMKNQVNTLLRNSKQIVNKAFSRPNVWWHKNPTVNIAINAYDQLGNQNIGRKYPATVDDCVRITLGELGVILERFGFNVTTKRQASDYREYWFLDLDGNNSSYPYFPHLLEWSEEMQDTLFRYNVFFKRARALFSQIEELRDAKRRQELTEIWQTIE